MAHFPGLVAAGAGAGGGGAAGGAAGAVSGGIELAGSPRPSTEPRCESAAPPAAGSPRPSTGRSGWSWTTLHSIAARFSSGVVGPPFSKPLQSTLEILPSPARNTWLPLAVNVYFERYSNTP